MKQYLLLSSMQQSVEAGALLNLVHTPTNRFRVTALEAVLQDGLRAGRSPGISRCFWSSRSVNIYHTDCQITLARRHAELQAGECCCASAGEGCSHAEHWVGTERARCKAEM